MNQRVNDTLHQAHTAFHAWRDTHVDDRVALLRKIADYYENHADDVAVAIAKDMGKPVTQGRGEAATCANIFRYYADHAKELLQPDRIPGHDPIEARVELHPTGVVLAVMPWNFPHYQLARVLAPNLLLGNAIVFKHASICRRSAEQIEAMVRECGAPDGLVINTKFSHAEVYGAIAHDLVTGVTFTGGEIGGQRIGEAAGKHLKKAVLELGGNDPFIVFDVSNVQEIAKIAARQRLSNAGQTCTSPKRVILHHVLFDEFVEAYSAEFLAAQPGDPLDESTLLGPLSSEGAADELRNHMKEAETAGFTILGDTGELNESGRDFSPFVILHPDRDHPLWKTELFGPITMIVAADTVQEAISIANDSPYGLGATVFTDSDEHAQEFAHSLENGMVAINTLRGANPGHPFGGVKRSGIGRELGSYGLREFANLKLIVEAQKPSYGFMME